MRIVRIDRASGDKKTVDVSELERVITAAKLNRYWNKDIEVDELLEQVKKGLIDFGTPGFVYKAERLMRFPLPWRGH